MSDLMNDANDAYAPYLLEGVTPEMTLTVARKKLGRETIDRLQGILEAQALLTLAADVYRRERLLQLWTAPQTLEEAQIISMVEAGVPLALDSLCNPGPVDGVTPTLYRLPEGAWRLGTAEELGPVFACTAPAHAVALALRWIGQAQSADEADDTFLEE